ncbi:hypothetical protein PYK79_03540 [Streptomyces sp. ID05-04B]|nr:hypothetical protein [Streptomyces sp. ID05-04B]MDX5562775.1 hypothetical protein [Streptomyces sp. ID05-04B]
MGTILLTAVSLTGCSAGDGGAEGGHGGGKNGALDPFHQANPLAKLSVPAAYDAGKGWDETLNWVPGSVGSLPVTVAPRAGEVALMYVASEGYTIKVRAADTGRVHWTSTPWNPPTPLEGSAGDPAEGEAAEIPDVTAVEQDGREYIVAYAHGLRGKDDLHKGTEVVRLAVYPAEAAGASVKPLRQIDVPVTADPGEVHVSAAGGRVLVGWGSEGMYPESSVAVDLATGKTVAYDNADDLLPQCAQADICSGSRVMAASADGPLVGMGDGGFGMPGRWFSDAVRPNGVAARAGILGTWNGMVYGVNDGHLLAGWQTAGKDGSDTDPVWSVHDVRTGHLEATMACGYALGDGINGSNRGAEREYPVVTSPDSRYLAAGPVAFDLRQKKGICLAGDGDRKSIAIASIRDDGTAYGAVQEDSAAVVAQLNLIAGPDSAKVLGTGADVPYVTSVNGAGLFLGRDDDKNLRVSLRLER